MRFRFCVRDWKRYDLCSHSTFIEEKSGIREGFFRQSTELGSPCVVEAPDLGVLRIQDVGQVVPGVDSSASVHHHCAEIILRSLDGDLLGRLNVRSVFARREAVVPLAPPWLHACRCRGDLPVDDQREDLAGSGD